MTDTVEDRVARLEQNVVEICEVLRRIEQTIAVTQQTLVQIRRNVARSVAPVAYGAPDGTVAIRDPDIIAQQYRTGTRGHAPKAIYPRPQAK